MSASGDRLAWDAERSVYPAAWLVRMLFFASNPLDRNNFNILNDVLVFDDWQTYQMDLSRGVQRGYWEPQIEQTRRSVKHLR